MLEVPTLVLHGKEDGYFRSEMFNNIDRHVRHLVLPPALEDCSHWCPQDQ